MKKLLTLGLCFVSSVSFGQGVHYGYTPGAQFTSTAQGGQTTAAGANVTIVTNGNIVTISSSGGTNGGIATSNGTGTNTTITNITVNGTIAGTAIQPVAQGGTSTNSARSAGQNIGVFEGPNVGGNTQESWLFQTPAFEGQILDWYSNTKTANLVHAGSTTTGDWLHGFNFTSGIGQIGDKFLGDPTLTAGLNIELGSGPSSWSVSGDAVMSLRNRSTNSGNSGAFTDYMVCRPGFSITNLTIVSGGSGYALGDYIAINGGTVGALGLVTRCVVSGVSGNVVSAVKIFESGEYITAPSGTLSTTATSGGGSGLTFTSINAGLNIQLSSQPNADIGFTQSTALESLLPSTLMTVQNYNGTYNRAVAMASPSGGATGSAAGLDTGNFSGLYIDWVHGVSGMPRWTNGVHDLAGTNFSTNYWSLYASNVTGLVYAPYGIASSNFIGSGAGITGLGGANFSSTAQSYSVFGNQTGSVGQPNFTQTPIVTSEIINSNLEVGGFVTSSNNIAPYFNVKNWNAKGDRITDDTLAISNTFAAASAAGGGIIHFPIGGFLVTNTLVVPTNCYVEGEGMGHNFTCGSQIIINSTTKPIFLCTNGAYIHIHDLMFSNTAPNSVQCLVMEAGSGSGVTALFPEFHMERCSFWNGGLDLLACAPYTIDSCEFFGSMADNGSFKSASIYIANSVNPDAGDGLITGCSFYQSNSCGIYQLAGGGTKVQGCKFNGNGVNSYTYDIYCQPQFGNTIIFQLENCSLENFKVNGISTSSAGGGVTHNLWGIDNCEFLGINSTSPGIAMAGGIGNYCTISNIRFSGINSGQPCVSLNGMTSVKGNNFVIDNGNVAMSVTSDTGSEYNGVLLASGVPEIETRIAGDVTGTTGASVMSRVSSGSLIFGVATNTASFTLIQTNFISGRLYTNIYGRPILVSANATLSTTGVSGNANMSLTIPTQVTNAFGISTIVTSIAMNYTNVISGFVPASGTYAFTNLSSGAGDSSGITGGQIMVY